ncbi:MAG: DHH family phosphoesterase [Candidatus Pacearchaeota archaeon]|jgi:single-stranded DNA-specific DHH superfamily exonuclease
MTKKEVNFPDGSEQNFLDFINNLKESDKIALVSHDDCDGLISVKVINEVLKIKVIKFIDYKELNNELVKELKNKKINKIILTDVAIDNAEVIKRFEEFSDVLVIDHHPFTQDLNSQKTLFININGYCASYICYILFSKIKNIEKLDWLVASACLSDWQFSNNQEWMKKVYEKYKEKFNPDENKVKESKFWEFQSKISLASIYFDKNLNKLFDKLGSGFGYLGELEKYAEIITKEIEEELNDFKKESKKIGNLYFWEIKSKRPITSQIINKLSFQEKDNIFIFIRKDKGNYYISSRNQNKKVNLPELLKKLTNGFKNSGCGGHFSAAGGFFPIRYLETFKDRLFNTNQ